MPTKAEIKKAGKKIKLRLRTGDTVMIIAGKDKGQVGSIAAISPTERKAIIVAENPENPDQPIPLNAIIKHRKAKYQGEKSARVKLPAPIDLSNLMLIDPDKKEPTRVGRRVENGKIVRFAKNTGKTLVDAPNMIKE